MLGNLGKGWVGGAVAVVLIVVAGVLIWGQMSGSPTRPGMAGDVVRICLKDGTRFLGPVDAADEKAKCRFHRTFRSCLVRPPPCHCNRLRSGTAGRCPRLYIPAPICPGPA